MSRLNSFLTGLRAVDLSQYIPGPTTSLILADMGMDVLKIEPPHGDEMCRLGPKAPDGTPVYYHALNAGKTAIRMNLKDHETRRAFLDLVAEADVLLEGFRPGVMARLDLDFERLSSINPRLIYCSISGFGATGGLAAKAAHDGNYLAASGIMYRNGQKSPDFYDPPPTDNTGALYAAAAILGALNERNRTGRGCHIDLGLADVAMPLQSMEIGNYGANGDVSERRSTYLNGGAAYYQTYETRTDVT